jgi:tRNA1Val (adenine37-N6)-methyltransferase
MSASQSPNDRDETLDPFYHGRFRILQRRKGYRFSVDAPLLADFVRTRPSDELLELGTGSGVISILLSIKPFARIMAVEIQEGLADLARRNVALNGLEDRIEVVRADFRTYEPRRRFDLIFSNPPYIRRTRGSLSASAEKSTAKHELHGDIAGILGKTTEWLAPKGRACFVYPEKRRSDFFTAADESGLAVRRLRFVHPRAGEPANLFLVELGLASEIKVGGSDGEIVSGGGGGEPEFMPLLVLFGFDGKYTADAEALFSGA